jgi:hypothetical protein
MEAGQMLNIAHDITEELWAAGILDKTTGKMTAPTITAAVQLGNAVNATIQKYGVTESAKVQQVIAALDAMAPIAASI